MLVSCVQKLFYIFVFRNDEVMWPIATYTLTTYEVSYVQVVDENVFLHSHMTVRPSSIS